MGRRTFEPRPRAVCLPVDRTADSHTIHTLTVSAPTGRRELGVGRRARNPLQFGGRGGE